MSQILTSLEWGLVILSTLQLFSGITLLVINTVLVAVDDILIWGYYQSESIFGHSISYNYTLVTCALYVLGLALFCCGVFGISAIYLWSRRATFTTTYIVSSLVSLACFAVLFYVIIKVVAHQGDRLDRFQDNYSAIVYHDYAHVAEKRDYFDRVQQASRCCGYLLPTDWFSGSLGYIPKSCCKALENPDACRNLGHRLDSSVVNNTYLQVPSLVEAFEVGCYAKQAEQENGLNYIAFLFYGGITISGLLLQLMGLSIVVAYKLTNFNVIMRPMFASRL